MSTTEGKDSVFGNCQILSPNNEPIGFCANKRTEWYLKNKLAVELPPDQDGCRVIRLNFEPKGRDGMQNPLYHIKKPNICVVCGLNNNLSKHHTVPWGILKFFPPQFKQYNSHDVVALCVDCHHKYEQKSDVKKKEIAARLGITIDGYRMKERRRLRRVNSMSFHYLRMGDEHVGPKSVLLNRIRKLVGYEPSLEELHAFTKIDPIKESGYVEFGRYVAENYPDLNGLACEWRKHFVDVMQPKYLHEEWQVHRRFLGRLKDESSMCSDSL